MKILYFAWVRTQIGLGSETIEPQATTVADLLTELSARSDKHAAVLAQTDKLRVAVDQEFAELEASIVGAKEVAIFPPMTGG